MRLQRLLERSLDVLVVFEIKPNRETTIGLGTHINSDVNIRYNRTENEWRLLRPPERLLEDYNGLWFKAERRPNQMIGTDINIGKKYSIIRSRMK